MTEMRFGREIETEFTNARDLYRKAIVYQYNDVNKLHKHATETIKHFMAKATIFYLLRKMRHDVITEFTIEGIGRGDIFDLHSRTQYEIESKKSIANINRLKESYLQAGIDLVIIQIGKMPTDIKGMQEFLEPWVRPD